MQKIYYTILFCLLSTFSFAQVSLEISVFNLTDRSPVSGLTVFIENTEIGLKLEKVSDSQGQIRLNGLLTSGAYTIYTEENDTFYDTKLEQITFRSNERASVQLLVPVKREINLEEIIITPSTSLINTMNAEVASSLSQRELEALPVEGRDITRSLFRLPNVTQATGFFPEAPNVSINGANSLFTNYLIDGMDNNERFLGGQKFAIPVGFTRDITVLTNNYSTEFGLTGNGIINITTRSGSNELGGEVFFLTRPGPAIDASSPFAQRDLSGNQVKDGFQRYQFGFGFGGPIIKNKTFYYINAEQTIDLKDNLLTSPALNVNETVRGENLFTYISGKIDHFWNERLSTSLRVNAGIIDIERQGGGLEGGTAFPSSANVQDRNSLLVALRNIYVENRLTSETNIQFSRFRWNYGRSENGFGPQVSVLDQDGQNLAVLGHPGFIFDSRENTIQFQQKLTYELNRHSLKAGVEIISADHSLFGGGNVDGNYTVVLSPEQITDIRNRNLGASLGVNDIPADVEVSNVNVEIRPTSFGKRQNIYSFYLEDAFAVNNRLNLTLGLRYDYDNLSKSGSDQGDFNNIAPRFSFNYKISPSISIRGGYGIFYEKILYAVYSDALQQNTTSSDYQRQLQALVNLGILPTDTDIDRITFDGNLSASLSGVGYLQAPRPEQLQEQRAGVFSNERRILNPNGWDNPFTHQISLGYQQQLNQNTLVYVDFVHNRSYNLFRLRDLNAPAPFTFSPEDPSRSPSEADQSRPIPISENNTALIDGEELSGVARNVVVSETEGESRYWAASFNLQKDKGSSPVSYRFIYTLSFLENNTEDINFRAQDSNNFGDEWGPSINDRRHVINSFVNYFPIDNLTLTLAGLFQSGQPINRTPDATELGISAAEFNLGDLNGDGRTFGDAFVGNSDRFPGESRNNDRLPWAYTFDASIQYQIPLGTGSRIEIRADVFNLFNRTNLSGFSNNATQSNQIQMGSRAVGNFVRRNAAPPRQFQFGLRYLF